MTKVKTTGLVASLGRRRVTEAAESRLPLFVGSKEVKVNDRLFYVNFDSMPSPESVSVMSVRVIKASAKRLVTTSGIGLSKIQYDAGTKGYSGLTPQVAMETIFSLSEREALERYAKVVATGIVSLKRRLVQAEVDQAWCLRRLAEVTAQEKKDD